MLQAPGLNDKRDIHFMKFNRRLSIIFWSESMLRTFRVMPLILGLFVIASSYAAVSEEKQPPKENDYELYRLLVDAIDQVEQNYVQKIDRRELIEAALRGVTEKLDPYSSYIGPYDIDQLRTTVESEFGGIGIQITLDKGELKIISPIYDTPAYKAGLLAGDRILEINGKSTDDMTLDDAIKQLKGKEGTSLALTVLHQGGDKSEQVKITRKLIHVETVLGDRHESDGQWDFMHDRAQRIGYVRVTAFSRDTAGELRRALEKLQSAGMRGLILDLRFNPGGLLNSAIEVSDLFISEGRIVSTKGRGAPEHSWEAHKNGKFDKVTMVVLVNRFSASASEIVAACLQDHKRAVIMGERTWGKGSVQSVIELEDGKSALKLTTSAYLRPSGKNIHRFPDAKATDEWGVMPDKGFELKLGNKELVELDKDRRDRDILRTASAEKPINGKSDNNSKKKEFADRELQMAVKYLSAELANAKQ
jgi:carboxyl-terminal processing protease